MTYIGTAILTDAEVRMKATNKVVIICTKVIFAMVFSRPVIS